jgi:hypothetical protein
MRGALFLATLALTVSCGGGPMAPSPSGSSLPAASLASGPYLLTVSMATSGSSGFSTCVSQSIGGQAPAFGAIFVPTPVQVDRSGDTIIITPDDPAATFRMQLEQSGANLSGTAAGQFHSTSIVVTVSGGTSGSAGVVTGVVRPVGPASASGVIDGTISVEGLSCSNNGHSWTLMPRS